MAVSLTCEVCDRPLAPEEDYVILNRYAVSAGRGSIQMCEVTVDGYNYLWNFEQVSLSGVALCFDGCVGMWLEGALIEARFDGK